MPRLSPLRAKRIPAYPRQQVVTEHPELLSRLPLRWQRCRQAAVAAGLMAALALSGCSSLLTTPTPTPLGGAPLPPSFLPESDVKQYLRSLVSVYGLSLSNDAGPAPAHAVYVAYDSPYDGALCVLPLQDGEVDLYDPSLKIGFDYVDQSERQASLPFASESPAPVEVKKGQPVILILDTSYDQDSIREQALNFIDWLKSQGII